MIFTTLLALFSAILNVIFGFLPVVESLPWGLDTALTTFVGFVHGLLGVFPFLELPWTLFLAMLLIEFLYFSFHLVSMVLRWFRVIG